MAMVSRDWCCLNRRCGAEFHSYDPAPECPKCGNVRVNWLPGGGHIGRIAGRMDRTVRNLAGDFGFTNLNSPSHSRLNRSAPRADHPGPERLIGQKTFAPGFHANVYNNKSSCETSLTPLNIKGATVRLGDSAPKFTPGPGSVPGPAANAVFHYRHRPS